MKYIRLYTDDDGESHFEDLDVQFQTVEFAPPAPPLEFSTFGEAENCSLIKAGTGWIADWHFAPFRQLHFYLSGEVEAQVSDGEIRRVHAGDMVLVEDTSGKGHMSRVVGNEDVVIAVVKLTNPNTQSR